MVSLSRLAPIVRVSTPLFAMALNAPTSSSKPAAVAVTAYIRRTWQTLTRSHRNLAAAAVDSKSPPLPDGRWPVYVAPNEDIERLESRLRVEMSPADFDRIILKPLPREPGAIRVHGLLYLPRPYVVPGGRFNEMYAGGLQTSTHRSGDQWDAPFGWAPLEWIAVQGMRRYGYDADADRVSKRFTSLVEDMFRKHGTILEKYDVVNRNTDPAGELRFGYTTDEAGFGWTNAVYTALLDGERR